MSALEPLQANGLVLPSVGHGFFTRRGGVSRGAFAALNCGLSNGDDPDSVRTNRALAAEALGAAADGLVTCWQVHGAEAVRVERPWRPADRPKADALVTDRPGIALGVLAADCGPVLLADPGAGVIGAAHAGWRGALSGVLEAAVAAMTVLGATPARITAALGPCIGQASYEVGPEFRSRFLAEDPASADRFALPAPNARPHFDLKGYVADRLARAGVGRIEVLSDDTYANPERFFSFRRTTHEGGGGFGVMLSAIVLA